MDINVKDGERHRGIERETKRAVEIKIERERGKERKWGREETQGEKGGEIGWYSSDEG